MGMRECNNIYSQSRKYVENKGFLCYNELMIFLFCKKGGLYEKIYKQTARFKRRSRSYTGRGSKNLFPAGYTV